MGVPIQGLVDQNISLPSSQVLIGNDLQELAQLPFQQPMLVPVSQSVQEDLPAGIYLCTTA